MMLLSVIQRFGLCRSKASQFALSLLAQVTSPTGVSFSREFHRESCPRTAHSPGLSFLNSGFGHSSGRIGTLLGDLVHEDIKSCDTKVLEKIHKAKDFASGDKAIDYLDNSDLTPSADLIFSLIWALREEWKLAFLVYKWGMKWDCIIEKSWCLIICLLGSNKKFCIAWSLIHELCDASKDTQRAMLIMIDSYAAANQTDKAIKTFNLMQKFKFSPDLNTYFAFLDILCNHGNVEEAEDFMHLNKKFFPLEVESFNIILSGWCNISIDILEAKRVWRDMSRCCIEPDGISYAHMISCYSSVGNLFDSLRLYDQMKKRGWIPGIEVYQSLIRILLHENCFSEALKIVDRMKELGLELNAAIYEPIICSLCKAAKFGDAKKVLARMLSDGIDPNHDTYSVLLEVRILKDPWLY